MTDWSVVAHQAAEDHLEECELWMSWFDEGEPEGERPAGEDPSSAPYDGCQTCVIRETLHAAWPVIEEGLRAELAIVGRTGFAE